MEMNPYEICPVFENENYVLRLVEPGDAPDLLKVYSDEAAQKVFNSDNCVDDFRYTTLERMYETIEFWLREYALGYYVRWTVRDKRTHQAVGTIELFNRQAGDYFNNCGLLRLDLRSDFEKANEIEAILSLIIRPGFEMFGCTFMATKVPPCALERKAAVMKMGFIPSEEKLIGGHDGRVYTDYYVLYGESVER